MVMWGATHGYTILQLLDEDIGGIKIAWACGVAFSGVTVAAFLVFVILFINPSLPGSTDEQL